MKHLINKINTVVSTQPAIQKPPQFGRASGILMHIASLPGPYGIGTLGQSAKDFVDFLDHCGCAYWQVLPLGPIDGFNSPYQSLSAFAGNPYFIDPDALHTAGLLTEQEIADARYDGSPWATAYNWIKDTRPALFHKAFSRVDTALQQKIDAFTANQPWLEDYALYTAIAKDFGIACWADWPNKTLRKRDPKTLDTIKEKLADAIAYEIFLQYLFFTQWQDIKSYANQKGIAIIGDMPIYVALGSADVWAHPELFDLDQNDRPRRVAGVPPDYFSETGQLWGNPLYDWQAIKKDHYRWWLDRLGMALTLFDTVRIDHFRAFSAYWAVPADEETAQNGKWLPGPGMDFFNEVYAAFNFATPRIIAEDLGVLDDDVLQLLGDSGFPGMRVMQFAFIDTGDGIHWPHNYLPNTVAYTGTHDNNTLLGYLWDLNDGARQFAFEYINYLCEDDAWQQGGPKSPVCHAFIRHLWMSAAKLTIVPMQDFLGYGADTRMNRPGEAGGNWCFRIPQEALDSADSHWLFEMNRIYKRLKPQKQ